MARRELAALGLAALLCLPLASAHGDDLARVYDPLTHPLAGWLTADGRVALSAPGDGFLTLPVAGVGGSPVGTRWALTVPITASLLGGVAAHLRLRSDGAMLARPGDNALLSVATAFDGAGVDGTEQVVHSPAAALQPDTVYEFDVVTNSTQLLAKPGDTLGVLVAFLGLAPTGTPGLVLGASGSRASLTLRSTLDGLGHVHPPGWRHMTVDEFAGFEVTTDPVFDIHLHHGDPDTGQQLAKAGGSVLVRVVDAETPEQGAQHGPFGTDAPHVLRFSGLGVDEALQVWPSEVVMRALRLDQPGTLSVACEAGCNRAGPFASLVVAAAEGSAAGAPGAGTTQRLDPGKFAEVNLQLARNESFTWNFTTSPGAPLHWDIHAHPGNEVVTYARGDNATAGGTFTAPAAGIYSLLLENSGPQPVTVTYSVQGGTPYVPPKGVPFGGALLLPALLAAALLAWRR